MIDAEKALLYTELKQGKTKCGLNKCDSIASDFIVQKIGYEHDNVELIVPICKECIEYINDGDMCVLYCVKCHSSQWIYKPKSKLEYGDKTIIWMDRCPNCHQ